MKTIAILGYPGAGKTWVVSQFIRFVNSKYHGHQLSVGLVKFHQIGNVFVVGNYDGSKFQGTDRLSMAVAPHFENFFGFVSDLEKDIEDEPIALIVAEGDRINCMPFFKNAMAHGELIRVKLDTDPVTLKQRRDQRNHEFPQSFLKTVATKVDKHTFDHVMNSDQLLEFLKSQV